jgi:hypothetical protein
MCLFLLTYSLTFFFAACDVVPQGATPKMTIKTCDYKKKKADCMRMTLTHGKLGILIAAD